MAGPGVLQFIGRFGGGELDVMVYLSDTHRVAVWTAQLATGREIVGLEVMPLAGDPRPRVISPWLQSQYEAMSSVDVLGLSPVPSSMIRQSVSFRRVMRDRAIDLGRSGKLAQARSGGVLIMMSGHANPKDVVTEDELALADSVLDAVIYVAAMQDGVSPIRALSEHRTISPRTAEGRIARARRNGLLTPAVGRRASGRLTPYAEDLLARLEGIGQSFATKEEVPGG